MSSPFEPALYMVPTYIGQVVSTVTPLLGVVLGIYFGAMVIAAVFRVVRDFVVGTWAAEQRRVMYDRMREEYGDDPFPDGWDGL